MTVQRTALAGAIALNLPTVVAAAYLPAAPLLAMAATLAMLGAALGALVGWSFEGGSHELIELHPPQQERRSAA